MYYKIDLSNYKPRETRIYLEFDKYNLSPYQLESIQIELDNFKDSYGHSNGEGDRKPWKNWNLDDLKYRLENNWTFYLIGNGKDGLPLPVVEGWAFIDWNRKYPYLNNRYVTPKFRKGGLGNDLVWLRCNEVVKRGLNTASIRLDAWNAPSLSVMKENIFTKINDI